MTLIKTKKQFEAFYPYKNSKPQKYPKKYPCLVENVEQGGGIGGSYLSQFVIYIPKDVDLESFVKGVNAESRHISSD